MSESNQLTRTAFADMRRGGKARHRDIARHLGLSEAALVAAHVGAPGPVREGDMHATRLMPAWAQMIGALESLGEVMALTRNDSCVHEKTGTYEHANHDPHVGLVLGGEIDLRLFYRRWAHGFAVCEAGSRGMQRSLQFYDAAGVAIHKVFLRPQSDLAAFEALTERFRAPGQSSLIALEPPPPKALRRADPEIDQDGLRKAWAGMRDTHEFFGLLQQFGVSRTQALRLAGPQFARRVDAGSCRQLLQAAARGGVPIMVFVGNPGMIQIHTGRVSRIEVVGPWLNVLDARFNLHLREDHIADSWVVSKPTVDGWVTSLELFDAGGETIAMLFGERKPGKPELQAWRVLLAALEQEAAPCQG